MSREMQVKKALLDDRQLAKVIRYWEDILQYDGVLLNPSVELIIQLTVTGLRLLRESYWRVLIA